MSAPMSRYFLRGLSASHEALLDRELHTLSQPLTVLLSAYACEPGLGSEASVGWGWVTELSKTCRVHVITRESNRARIEVELSERPLPNANFWYFDLPAWMKKWKRGNRGVHLYYMLWQLGAYLLARRLQKIAPFDLVHHVTFASVRFPSFMILLGRPFIFGPVGGGEYAPIALWWPLGWRVRIREILRYVSLRWVRYSPVMWFTFYRASRIFVTSSQTSACLPERFLPKTRIMLAIAMNDEATPQHQGTVAKDSNGTFKVVFAGNLLYLKGMEHGLRAFARLSAEFPNSELTVIGHGPEQDRWQRLVSALGVESKVNWVSAMARERFLGCLPEFDALLFPGLHDSGGMVVLEALAAGLPVVCLDIGGPGELVTDDCGFRIPATGDVVDGMYRALVKLAVDLPLREQMGTAGRDHAACRHSWATKALEMRKVYDESVQTWHTGQARL